MPRVSICIPAYKPEFFETTLKSAIAQSYPDTEIIVSDDCPTDAIEKICDRYSGFVSYSRNPDPGESTNVIRLAGLANGEFIKFLFDDDVLTPFCVQFLLEALEQTASKGTKLAFSPRYSIDENNRVMGLINHFQIANENKLIEGNHFIRLTAINHANLIGEYSTTLLYREDCFDDDGVFRLFRPIDGVFRGLLDLSGWIDIAKRGAFVGCPHPLSYFRQHGGSQSNHQTNPIFIYAITFYENIMEMAFAEGYLLPQDLGQSLKRLISTYEYWRNAFPELNPRIDTLQKRLALLPAM
ncbi:glycosyltransferase family 2 protein [Rhizobium sp. L1K21]|uniref:glycosyltransferase family 2 protein n=1 Tax=Rhizobium sp. L1K21 TaxID=2954933 RepID=UPI0020920BFD|nr:glycosyltransferase family 2 protein [Rhizobium sp. L1K21]MCO6188385.1 glycosyltransferase [Rhizobium sp. L1K21]